MGRAEDIFEKLNKEGEAGIDEFIALRQSAELYLDFKRSANNGSEKVLHDRDLNNLAKAISGFGNSEGGVIVWGIDASPDFDGFSSPGPRVFAFSCALTVCSDSWNSCSRNLGSRFDSKEARRNTGSAVRGRKASQVG